MWEGDAFEGENLQVLYIVDLVRWPLKILSDY